MTLPELDDRAFGDIRDLLYRGVGILLSPTKKSMVIARLGRRISELGFTTFGEYVHRVRASEDERIRFIDALTTNETRFFREPSQFEFLVRDVLPRWRADARAGRRAPSVRLWSAACSSGEEPFSIAMLLLTELGREGFTMEILATDISTRALERARSAEWSIHRAEQIPTPYLKAFMLRGTGSKEGRMCAGKELRQCVRFERFNLLSDPLPSGGFDLIFCRNVLMYFSDETRRQVVERLAEALVPGGLLLVGHAEPLHFVTRQLSPVAPTIYSRRTTSC